MRRLTILAGFSGALLSGQGALADTIRSFSVANWSAGAYSSNDTKEFTHCAASSKYNSGITLLFAVNKKYQWSIGFVNPSWNLGTGETFDVAFKIDNASPINGTGSALSNDHVAVRLADSTALFEKFLRGRQLRITALGKVYSFNLTDTSQILPALLRCVGEFVESNRNDPPKEPERSNPERSTPTTPDRSAPERGGAPSGSPPPPPSRPKPGTSA